MGKEQRDLFLEGMGGREVFGERRGWENRRKEGRGEIGKLGKLIKKRARRKGKVKREGNV